MSLVTELGHLHPQRPQDLAHATADDAASKDEPVTVAEVRSAPGQLNVTRPGEVALGVMPEVETAAGGPPTLPVAEPQAGLPHLGALGLLVPCWQPD